ncbi:MAG: LolA family protein [Solirubrobacteraceae bacterium]
MPTAKLLGLMLAITVLAGSISAVALGALSAGGPVPPPKPLANAIHDAAAASSVPGVTATISFTNHLIDSSSIQGGGPLLKGASGRLWASSDGHVRLELQGERGDTQVLVSPTAFSVYDASSNTAYEGTIPTRKDSAKPGAQHSLPTVAKIQDELSKLMQHVGVSGATPTNVGGAAAYSVSISPKHSGGLLGSAELAWDAAHGVPLRAAVYAQGQSAPVLELTATSVSLAPVASSVFAISPPAGAKVVRVKRPTQPPAAGHARSAKAVDGVAAVSKSLPFKLSAPATLAGLPRAGVKLLDWSGKPAALVTYGQHLGAIAVVERMSDAAGKPGGPASQGKTSLPSVQVNGASGTELATALGTLLRFERSGVSYIVAGSVPPAAAEAAARGL